MDERKPQSEEIEEWLKELLPDGAADVGMWQQHPERTSVNVERPNTCQLSVDSHPYKRNHHSQNHLMQTSGGCNAASMMVKREQESLNVLQHTDQTTLQKLLETKSGVVLDRAHPRMQMPTLHHSQNLTLADQLKPVNQTQGMHLGPLQASSESNSQVDLTNSIDWVNAIYQKILQVKEVYLSQFILLHHKMQEMKRQASDVEIVNKWEKSRAFVERTIRLLNISKQELVHSKKERVFQMMNDTLKYISQIRPRNAVYAASHQVEASGNHIEAPQIQQRENHLQFNSAPASLHQPLRAGPGGSLSLPQSSLTSFNVGSSAGVHKVDAALNVNSYQYNNLMRPAQQWAPSPRKGGSQMGFDPRALRMLLHPSGGVSQYNNIGNSQQTVTSSRNIFNSLDYSVSSMAQQMPVSMPPLQNNQQDQAMKRQKMKQSMQQQQQQQQQLMSDKNKQHQQQMLQKRNEDTKLRRFVGINQKWSPVLPPSSSPYAISPQNSQQSSSQLELKDLSSKFPKSATPSLSSASPSALPSPLTPLTPSSMPADFVKSPLLEESSKLAKNPVVASQGTNRNQLATDTQRSTKSCLHRQSISSGDKQSPQAKGDPLKRLVEVVKSVSYKTLRATSRDINAVTSLTDRVAGNFLRGKPTKVVFHDLADDIIINSDQGASTLEHNSGMKLRVKRELDTVALDDFTAHTEFCASGSVKRLKTESNDLLLEEIKEINKTLIEVAVDVMNLEDVSRPVSDEGTLIRCSYIPLGLSGTIKIPNTSKLMFPNLLLELIVSADYPNSSPTVLENASSSVCDAEEGKYMWMKAKSNFILSIRKFTHPMSVKDMAEAWNVSAREVFNELAGQMGGGSFSSTYGNWETCAVAV